MDEHCTDLDACGSNHAITRVNENEHCESCCDNSSKHNHVIKKIRYIGVDFDDAKILPNSQKEKSCGISKIYCRSGKKSKLG